MRKEPGRGLTLVRSQEVELGQRSEPWPVTLMSYGDTPRPRSIGGYHGHGLRTESSPWSHSQSGGGRAQPPHTHSLLLEGHSQGLTAPRSATRHGKNSDREPGTRALSWHLIRKHNCGGHRLSGSDAAPGTMGTACQAARLARPSPGPSVEELAWGPFYRRGNGGSGCTRKRRATFPPSPGSQPRRWTRALASAPRFRRTTLPLGGTAGQAVSVQHVPGVRRERPKQYPHQSSRTQAP